LTTRKWFVVFIIFDLFYSFQVLHYFLYSIQISCPSINRVAKTIPADIQVAETGSADIASTVFLYSIYKLFNSCRLMHTYMPPYHLNSEYIKLDTIHFVNYRRPALWHKTRSEQIAMFKHYLDELKGFL
jgi:hypothetical protein